ncbi:MAG: molecular chaperone DnaJ [Lachnospiraceae bacterium]|nr:molecular chaperone DnaJ [Lachnospiraceae bacterium]
MKIKFFVPAPETLEELKKLYKTFAVNYHPDVTGGDAEIMKIVNTEYDYLFPLLKDLHKTADGETYTAKTPNTETPEQFKDIISKIIHLDGILIEIIGSFIWITGDTRQYKDLLKALNFKWHKTKIAWYMPPEGYRKYNNKNFSLDQIRDIFGNQEVESKVPQKIRVGFVHK